MAVKHLNLKANEIVIIYNMGDAREFMGKVVGKSFEGAVDEYIVMPNDLSAFYNPDGWSAWTLTENRLKRPNKV